MLLLKPTRDPDQVHDLDLAEQVQRREYNIDRLEEEIVHNVKERNDGDVTTNLSIVGSKKPFALVVERKHVISMLIELQTQERRARAELIGRLQKIRGI